MILSNSNKPAFPISEEESDRIESGVNIYTGLTKREYFAGLAMQGLLSNPAIIHIHQKGSIDWITEHSILQSESLLLELSKNINE